MDEKDYLDKVKEHIELDKTLYKVKPEYRETVKALLEERQNILTKNSLFADFKLKRINLKIQKFLELSANTEKDNSCE